MRSEGDEARGLLSLVPSENLFHRTFEVVITELLKYATKISERPLVRFQKSLLTGMRKGAMEGSTTGHAAHAKHVGRRTDSCYSTATQSLAPMWFRR